METPQESVMAPNRRQLLKGLAASPALAWPLRARAAWPDKPLRLVVPSAAGGAPDVVCRVIAAEMAKALGQPINIDNRPGASGNIGMQEIVRAAADGTTLGYANVGTLAINRSLFARLPYEPMTQLLPVAMLGQVSNALVVRNDLPVNDLRQFIAYAKARPGKLVAGSAGNGTTGHLGLELFKSMSGSFIVHVPYRGSPQAITDLIGGQIDLMFDNLASIGPHIRSGRVKALGVSSVQRVAAFGQLPTLAEGGLPGYATTAWGGLVVPAGTPADIVQRLHLETQRAMAQPAVQERWASLAFEALPGPAERLFEQARRETPMWAEVIKRSGAKID
jgi:tripartite-type tricarboxylate transporter receptor subunit TctC